MRQTNSKRDTMQEDDFVFFMQESGKEGKK